MFVSGWPLCYFSWLSVWEPFIHIHVQITQSYNNNNNNNNNNYNNNNNNNDNTVNQFNLATIKVTVLKAVNIRH